MRCSATSVSRRQTERDAPNSVSAERRRRSLICQDLLIFQVKGISCYGKVLMENGAHMDKTVVSFIENVLFTTLTNVNFDVDAHLELLRESQRIKEQSGRWREGAAIRRHMLPTICRRARAICCAMHRLRESCTTIH